jgi:predicted RNA binding protein YcfA (HicA-like mRNA interferase family)
MSRPKRDYVELAKEYGFVLVRCKKHAIFKHANGTIVVGPATPSDSRRGIKQFKKDIKLALSRNNMLLWNRRSESE